MTSPKARHLLVLLAGCMTLAFPASALASIPSHTQAIDPGNALNAVSCVPGTSDCVVADSEGDALYSTDVSVTASASWTPWSGPEAPGEAIACPSASLCVLADGQAAEPGVGGNVYYATSLGGSWSEAFSPAFGAVAVSCASTTLCVSGADAEGVIRYTSRPASEEWFGLNEIGGQSGAMIGVDCISPSFCAVVDDAGNIHVADTEAKIEEEEGWKSADIDGSTALHGVACSTVTSCVAVDRTGHVIRVAVNGSGEPSVSGQEDLDGSNDLTAVTCVSDTCVAVDGIGNVFVSTNGGEGWSRELTLGTDLTSVSCSSIALCVAADTAGSVTAFDLSSLAVGIMGEGKRGATGSTGQEGPAGKQGQVGLEGSVGKIELVTCAKARKKRKCTTKLISGTVKFTAASVHATVSRKGLVYAAGTAHTAHGRLSLRLTPQRRLRPGRYLLTLTSGSERRKTIRSEAITLG